MAFSHGSVANAYLAGFDVTLFTKDVSEDANVDVAEISTLGLTSKTFIPGMEDSKIKVGGFYDSNSVTDASTLSFKLDALKRTITQLVYMPAGDLLGLPAYLVQGELTGFSVKTATNSAAEMDFDMQGNTGFLRGVVLFPKTAVGTSAAVPGSDVDNLTLTSNGLSAMLQVFTVTGSGVPTLACKVQHSTDGSTWLDLTGGGFTNSTAAGSQYITTAAGQTVNRHLRIMYTITGTTPNFTFAIQAARN